MNIKHKTVTETKGKPTVTVNEKFELPEEIAGLIKTLIGAGPPPANETRVDTIAGVLARLYSDSHEYRDGVEAVRRERAIYKRLGVKHWQEEGP